MRIHFRPSIALFLIVLLSLTGCGRRDTTTPASSASPTPNVSVGVSTTENLPQNAPPQGALRPVNVAEQLTYVPGRAGGGSVSDCYDYDRYQNKPDQTDFYTTKAELNIGDSLSICYYNYEILSVTEQIIDENGNIVRELNFTIDTVEQDKILDATDFTAMPGMSPGLYRVITRFPDRQEELSFRLTGQLVKSADSTLRVLSSGPTAAATSSFEYVILDSLPPNASVVLAFYTPCFVSDERLLEAPEDERYTLSVAEQSVFVTAAQVTVDETGWAVIQVPSQLSNQLDPTRNYTVVAYPALDSNVSENAVDDETTFPYASAALRGSGGASAIPCPYIRAPNTDLIPG